MIFVESGEQEKTWEGRNKKCSSDKQKGKTGALPSTSRLSIEIDLDSVRTAC